MSGPVSSNVVRQIFVVSQNQISRLISLFVNQFVTWHLIGIVLKRRFQWDVAWQNRMKSNEFRGNFYFGFTTKFDVRRLMKRAPDILCQQYLHDNVYNQNKHVSNWLYFNLYNVHLNIKITEDGDRFYPFTSWHL